MTILRRVANGFSALVVACSSVMILASPAIVHAAAQTCTWTGTAGDSKFSSATNWSNCNSDVPQTGDILAFSISSLATNPTLDNDMSSLSVSGITFSGTNADYHRYTISGNSLTVTGNITNTATDGGSPADSVQSIISTPLVLGADVTATDTGLYGAITTAGHSLTIATTATCGVAVSGAISGSGSVLVPASSTNKVNISGNNASFTGSFVAGSGSKVGFSTTSSIGQASGITATNATIAVGMNLADRSLSTPLNLSGELVTSKYYGDVSGCIGGSSDAAVYTLTLSNLSLNGNLEYYGGNVNAVVGGTYSSNGHTATVRSGSSGTLTLPSGTIEATAVTNEYKDNTPTQNVTADNKVTAVISGTVGSVYASRGGLVKGTGTIVGSVYVEDGGIVAPGNSPGCLTSDTLNLYGVYQFELGGTDPCTGYDQLKVLNAASVSTAVTLGTDTAVLTTSRYNGYTPKQGQVFTIIDQGGDKAVSGTFKDLPEGATFTQNGIVFKISYVGGTGNDVTLTVQNVPATPNTGVALVSSHPIASLLTLIGLSGALVVLARRLSKFNPKA